VKHPVIPVDSLLPLRQRLDHLPPKSPERLQHLLGQVQFLRAVHPYGFLSSTLSIYLAVSQTCSAITSHVLCIPQGGRGAPCRAPSRMPLGAVPQSFRAPFGRMGPSSCLAPGWRRGSAP
jgi:hypothetical protein